jgi:penicillin-binding protein 1A
VAAAVLGAAVALPAAWVASYVYFDRSRLPDLEPFVRFEPPGIGRVHDARGKVLIELAHEYRRVVTYDEIPLVLRQAVLAAEDKNFFSHSGVDYSALPRVIRTATAGTLASWRSGGGLRLPQGGSTLTQQLVRAYFLTERTSRQGGDTLFHDGFPQRLLGGILGVPATNKLLRKLEEVRLALWLEKEMHRRFGSKENAKRELFARCVSFHYVGNGRYGLAAASEYYFGRPLSTYTIADAGAAALLAGIGKSPRDYAPSPGNLRAVRRRNQILALMARNGYIPEAVARSCQAEPLRVTARGQLQRKTEAPAGIGHVFAELSQRGGSAYGAEDLFQGRISVRSTLDHRVQGIVNEALENGLALYEKRHPGARGSIQGSVVVLHNANAAILAEAGGRRVYEDRDARYSDLNRVTGSLRQPGSAWKPLVYLAAFRGGLDLDTTVPDEPIALSMGEGRAAKWISNYDNAFKGPIPVRQALAQSRNAVAVWITRHIGVHQVIRTARELGIRTPLRSQPTLALGDSEVRLLELANVYRAMASGLAAEPYVVDSVTDASGAVLYEAAPPVREIRSAGLRQIQEGLRGVVRLPDGTAHSLARRDFPIPVMGKTGTTSDYRDALFVGSTYGPQGITVAVRIGFDDNRQLGRRETGGRVALPIFREIMLRAYEDDLLGPVPKFPRKIEEGIDEYLAALAQPAAPPAPAEEEAGPRQSPPGEERLGS